MGRGRDQLEQGRVGKSNQNWGRISSKYVIYSFEKVLVEQSMLVYTCNPSPEIEEGTASSRPA